MNNNPKDHRQISKELELYFLTEKVGQGLPMFLPDYTLVRNQIQQIIRNKWEKFNFQEVITPLLGRTELYETSGHLQHYTEDMFPIIEKNNESYLLRAMTCPHHCVLFQQKPRSYHELPMRISENSLLFRYESSGSLQGISRTRWFELPDHHIFVTVEGLKDEVKHNFFLIKEILEELGLKIDRLICSTHDPQNTTNFHPDAAMWKASEELLLQILQELGVDYTIREGDAAFYGPKLDFEVKQPGGKHVTIPTIQLDFFLPKRFNLKYVNHKQELEHPVMIHHSPGSYSRLIAALLEQQGGRWPIKLAPCQLVLLPINDQAETLAFCQTITENLAGMVRTKTWTNKTIGFRIKEVHEKKIPYYLVVGKKEIEQKECNIFNTYNNQETKITTTKESLKQFFQNDINNQFNQ